MGLDQPDARRGGEKMERTREYFFSPSNGTAAVGNELLRRGWGFLSSSSSSLPPPRLRAVSLQIHDLYQQAAWERARMLSPILSDGGRKSGMHCC